MLHLFTCVCVCVCVYVCVCVLDANIVWALTSFIGFLVGGAGVHPNLDANLSMMGPHTAL